MATQHDEVGEDFSADRCWERRVLWQWLVLEGFTPLRPRTGGSAIGYYSAHDTSGLYDGHVRYYAGPASKKEVQTRLQAVAERLDQLTIPYEWGVGEAGYAFLAVSVRHVAKLLPAEPIG